MEISKMNLSDLKSISNILESEFDNFWNYNILKLDFENPFSIYFICRQNDEIVGFAGMSIIFDTAEINNIVIKKSKRGNGYASLLLEKIIDTARFHHCKIINLEVSINNDVAINLYKKFEFVQVGLRQKYYNGIDALLFSKKLI